MFSNLKAKKRIIQLLIAVVVVALTATGSAFLLNDFVQEAKAADYTITSVPEWNSYVGGASSGSTVNITLGGNIEVTAETGGKLSAVPSGVTVNLNMAGKNITWDNIYENNGDEDSWNSNLMSKSYTSSTYSNGEYWGFITNNGTLNILGSGTIRNKKVHSTAIYEDNGNAAQRSAVIVNNGNLMLGSGITVESYLSHSHSSSEDPSFWSSSYSYSHNYIYNCAVYNANGTVTSGATINAASLSAGSASGGTEGRQYAFVYGIYGGNINITGGYVNVDALAGLMHANGDTGGKDSQTAAYAIGVYGNDVKVSGNTEIKTYAKNWRDDNHNQNSWSSGYDFLFATGVMYTSTAPVIGPAVDVIASYDSAGSDTIQVWAPGGNSTQVWSDRNSNGSAGTTNHYISPVAKVSALNYNIEYHDSQKDLSNNFFGAQTPGGSVTSTAYRTLHTYNTGSSSTVSAPNINDESTGTRKTVAIIDGAPASNSSGSPVSANGSPYSVVSSTIAGGEAAGNQYVLIYRYYDVSGKLTVISYSPDTNINSKSVFDPENGYCTVGATIIPTSEGDIANSYFYEFLGFYYDNVDCSKFAGWVLGTTSINKGNKIAESNSIPAGGAGKTTVIFADYQAKAPTNIKVVAASSGNTINYLSTGTSFETTYTGATLVPGTDFNLGIIDMNNDTDASVDNTSDNTDATSFYDVAGSDSSKVQLVYSYSTDGGSTWTNGLPKNVGKYTIRVVVPSDTDISRSGAGNRNGGTFEITGEIKAATPSISGNTTATGTYGSTIAELIPTSNYTVTGKNNETMTGTWSYGAYAGTDYPTVDAGSVTLTWTPTGDCATNYKSISTTVTLSLSKRAVTVAPADSTVTYGTKSPSYVLNYTNLASCDESKTAAWLAASTFEVYYNGSWQAYDSTMVPGSYDMRIATFGGDTANNTFTTSGTSKLVINKAPLYYTAAATNKVYDGVASVKVVLTSTGLGVVNGDSYSATLTTTGTLANANAAENKLVTVVTDGLDFISSDKYYISIQNTPTVTVSKATPTATASSHSFSYDAERTLSKITINGEASVSGSWSWQDSTIVPTVDVSSYTAIFTPDDTTNYNTIEVPVTITVAKTVVTVSVDSKTISFADPAPALNLKYTGFTGTDTENTVGTTGTVAASTTYSMGKGVGTYPITITMTDYESNNYEFVAATDCTITVEKKNVTVTAPSAEITYGEAAPEFGVNDLIVDADALYGTDSLATLNEKAQFGITAVYTPGEGVGSYNIVASSNEVDNYAFTFVNGTLKVTKAVLTVTADDKSVDYNKQAPTFTWTFSGYKFPDSDSAPTGSPNLSTQYVKGNDAGEYAIAITVGTLSHPNYTFKLVGGTLTVNKLTIETTEVVYAEIVHGEAYSEAVFYDTGLYYNNVEIPGTFALKDSDTIADYTAATVGSGYRYVTVTGIFTPADSDNYNTAEVEVELEITRHSISGAPVITGTAMEGSEITVSVAGMSPSGADNYTYKWYVGGTQAATGTTYTVKTEDIGKSIYVIATADTDNGYEGSAQSSSVTAVEAFTNLAGVDQLDIEGANAVYTYDGVSHAATVAIKSEYAGFVSEDITVYYNGSTATPYGAGTYIVTIDIGVPEVPADADRDNYYGPVSGLEIGTITINKAPVKATFTVADKVYDGTRKVNNYNVVINGVVMDDDVRLDVATLSIVFNKSAAGVQNIDISGVKLVGNDIANYTLEIEETTATIEKATLKATAQGVTRKYNGSTQVDVEFTNITGYASIDSASTVYIESGVANATSADASEPYSWNITNITYALGGVSANNYVLEITNEATATVTITKATPVVVPPTVDGIVYNSTKTLANIDLDEYYNRDSNGYWQFDDTSIIPTVKKTQYAATYISQNNNYSDYSTYITVNVTPKNVVLTAVDTTVVYGKAASYSVKADGFTGTDSLATMGGTQPTYVCTYSVGENVGDYIIKINHNLDSNGNYTFTTANGTLTVVPADLYVTATATNRDYNGSTGVEVKFAIASGKYLNDDVVLSTTTANGTASSANAGTRTVSYKAPTISGTKASNYNLVLTPASDILTVTIYKLNPEGVVFPASATLEFGRDLSWTEFTDEATGDGYFEIVGDIPNALGTFIYEVKFVPADSVNYNTLSANIPLTVTICTVTPVVAIGGKVQSGEKLSVVFTGLPSKAYDYVQYQWYRISDTQTVAIANATNSTYELTDSDVGYRIACVTYFEATAPFVYHTDVIGQLGELEGMLAETAGSVEEENLTFWQRIVKWIQSIIEALTGIMFSMGM